MRWVVPEPRVASVPTVGGKSGSGGCWLAGLAGACSGLGRLWGWMGGVAAKEGEGMGI